MTLTKGFIQNAATTALDARLMDMAKVVCNSDGSPRVGVLGSSSSIVSATATLHLAVAAAEFVTSKGKADGVAIFTNNGTVNVPVTAAPVSNSRIDVLWVKHEDNTTGDSASLPIFGVTAGVAAASPTKPAIPTGCTELATLRIYAGTTGTNGGSNVVTNTYQMTAMRGGVVPIRDTTQLTAWTTAQIGQVVYHLAEKRMYSRRVTGAAPTGAWIPERAAFFADRSSGQAVGGWTVLSTAFAAPVVNDIGTWTGASGTIQVTHAGIYRIGGQVRLQNSANPMAIQLTRNSAAPDVNVLADSFVNGSATALNAGALVSLAAGDIVRILAYSAAANTVASAQISVELVSLT